jgi:phosphoribosylanthranilate isomerase
MDLKLKVCGMRDAENIFQITSLHPDYMGFIFYVHSPRYVGGDFEIPDNFPASIKRVGVFVNESIEKILETVDRYQLDYVQLHGNEPVELCHSIKNSSIGVIKVFSVDDTFDFKITVDYQKAVDFFLFDTKGKHYGGNAVAFDWNILKGYDQKVPFFLSGGLTPENISGIDSLRGMNIQALDVNSGIETSPGLKSEKRLKDLQTELKNLTKT